MSAIFSFARYMSLTPGKDRAPALCPVPDPSRGQDLNFPQPVPELAAATFGCSAVVQSATPQIDPEVEEANKVPEQNIKEGSTSFSRTFFRSPDGFSGFASAAISYGDSLLDLVVVTAHSFCGIWAVRNQSKVTPDAPRPNLEKERNSSFLRREFLSPGFYRDFQSVVFFVTAIASFVAEDYRFGGFCVAACLGCLSGARRLNGDYWVERQNGEKIFDIAKKVKEHTPAPLLKIAGTPGLFFGAGYISNGVDGSPTFQAVTYGFLGATVAAGIIPLLTQRFKDIGPTASWILNTVSTGILCANKFVTGHLSQGIAFTLWTIGSVIWSIREGKAYVAKRAAAQQLASA